MLGAQLPEWANSENLKWITLGIIAAMAFLIFIVVRFVQKLVFKGVFVLVFAGIGLLAWVERADLNDCAQTCSCNLLGQKVQIPADKNPACR